jgi:hypothetical protein
MQKVTAFWFTEKAAVFSSSADSVGALISLLPLFSTLLPCGASPLQEQPNRQNAIHIVNKTKYLLFIETSFRVD